MPRAAIVVSLRNEEAHCGRLFASLASQNYQNYEIVLVDDRSSDKTGGLLDEFARNFTKTPVTVIHLSENPGPNHKQYALSRGISATEAPFLLFTDADCTAGPEWAAEMLRFLRARPETGVVMGAALKISAAKAGGAKAGGAKAGGAKAGFCADYQSFDQAVRLLYTAGSAGLGAASGCFGNNIALSREALLAAGGYEALGSSVTEDAALVSLLRSRTCYAVRAVFTPETRVFTLCEPTWRAFFNQTLRWHSGGFSCPDWGTRGMFAFLSFLISAGILALFFLPFFPAIWPMPSIVLLCITALSVSAKLIFGPDVSGFPLRYCLSTPLMPVIFTLLTIMAAFRARFTW